MNTEQAGELIRKYNQGSISPEEKLQLDQWYNNEAAKEKARLSPNELIELSAQLRKSLPLHTKQVRLWPRIAVASAVAVMIFGAGLFYYDQQNTAKDQQLAAVQTNDIAPGKQGATLTLASGKKIRLADALNGKLANEAGVSITKTAEGELVYQVESTSDENKINTIATANGETYQVRLPDGSTVWLNAASSLTYSAGLVKNGKRSVRLTGEAYFSVAKDKSRPFVVQTGDQEVEVLGTEFNVNSYGDEAAISTALVEGSVKVTANAEQKVIRPGEQVLNNGKGLVVGKADLENITDWKDGDFNFDGVNFRTAMRKVGRWYNVEIIYTAGVPREMEVLGLVSRKKNLSEVLKFIESIDLVKFKLEGNKLYVSGKK